MNAFAVDRELHPYACITDRFEVEAGGSAGEEVRDTQGGPQVLVSSACLVGGSAGR